MYSSRCFACVNITKHARVNSIAHLYFMRSINPNLNQFRTTRTQFELKLTHSRSSRRTMLSCFMQMRCLRRAQCASA